MGSYVVCHNCHKNIYLLQSKEHLPANFRTTCNSCNIQGTYFSSEVYEEKWTYSCGYCNNKFYRLSPPPANVTCPTCAAKLSITYNDQVIVQQNGTLPKNKTSDSTVAAGILGAILGAAVGGPAGAVVGGILGGALGASSTTKKAKEGW